MSRLLAQPITDILLDKYAPDAHVASLLSQTCKFYRDAFPVTEEMWDLTDWLVSREGLAEGESIDCMGGRLIFRQARIVFAGRPRCWRITARLDRKNNEGFENVGLIVLGKQTASLVIVGESRWDVFKDSFQGIRGVHCLLDCLRWHTTLCHEKPEDLPPLPPGVRHRHRDNVPWTWARAFYVWRAVRPGGETWNQRPSCSKLMDNLLILNHTGQYSDWMAPRVRMI
jgi:hypothetical protein